jgi:hypothetical protein
MASDDDESDSGSDDAQETGANSGRDPELNSRADDTRPTTPHSSSHNEPGQPSQALQHRPKESQGKEASAMLISDIGGVSMEKFIIEVQVPPPERPWEYLRILEEDIVETVIEEVEHPDNELWHKIAFEDGREEEVGDLSSTLYMAPT